MKIRITGESMIIETEITEEVMIEIEIIDDGDQVVIAMRATETVKGTGVSVVIARVLAAAGVPVGANYMMKGGEHPGVVPLKVHDCQLESLLHCLKSIHKVLCLEGHLVLQFSHQKLVLNLQILAVNPQKIAVNLQILAAAHKTLAVAHEIHAVAHEIHAVDLQIHTVNPKRHFSRSLQYNTS
jgi:hypothetical protein